jgi:ribonucleotide reductase beta subunit family protein with ferritin-like domain
MTEKKMAERNMGRIEEGLVFFSGFIFFSAIARFLGDE